MMLLLRDCYPQFAFRSFGEANPAVSRGTVIEDEQVTVLPSVSSGLFPSDAPNVGQTLVGNFTRHVIHIIERSENDIDRGESISNEGLISLFLTQN